MSAAHTPGPWRIGCTTNSQRLVCHDDNTRGAASGIVARVTVRQCWEVEQEANARLITAAPELLAALIALYAVASVKGDKDYAAVTNAAAAIAKATGGAS